jgi:hypothetical protein
MIGVYYCAHALAEIGAVKFSPWADLSILAFQVARIAGLSH